MLEARAVEINVSATLWRNGHCGLWCRANTT